MIRAQVHLKLRPPPIKGLCSRLGYKKKAGYRLDRIVFPPGVRIAFERPLNVRYGGADY